MENIFQNNFFNPAIGNLTLEGVVNEITSYISKKPEKFYDVIVGCDSPSSEDAFFPVAVVVLRKGEGGRFFIKKVSYNNKKFYNWRQRITEEVLLSINLALILKEKLSLRLKEIKEPLDYQFRYIHADVGENGITREMIKEVTGLIRGNGFEPKIKPEAFVASVIADRYT